jgi:hypothetical protein
MYVYKKSLMDLWSVGFYDPDGDYMIESEYNKEGEAADRVHYLNGGVSARQWKDYLKTLERLAWIIQGN